MRFAIVLSSLVLAISSFSHAQSKILRQTQSQVMSARLGSNDWGLADVGCGAKGNVFVTVWDPAGEDPADRPLLMFDNSNLLTARVGSSRKDLGLSHYEDHDELTASISDGGVARLAWSKNALSLAVFSADGKLKSRTQLDPPAFLPYQLAVFPSGESLVSGLEHVHSRRAVGPYKSFTAIYDKNGQLLKRLSLPEDVEIDADAERGDSRYAHGPMFGNRAVSSGRARLADDGNIYLMRSTSPATVYVISSSGEVVRTLSIEPAGSGQLPFDMQVAGGRIAVEFALYCSADHCEGRNFTVADATTGQKLSDYSEDEGVGGVLACYSAKPERFTFLRVSEDNKLQIIEASAK
jgi:hypothetical protein